jgi:multiple sugar transport system permease protein
MKIPWIKVLIYVLLIIVSLLVAFPILWLLDTSLKTYPQIYAFPIQYIPKPFTFEHYYDVLVTHDFFRFFMNSTIISLGTGILSVALATLPAYAFSRFEFPSKKAFFIAILMCQMFPQVVFVVPFLILLKTLGLMDTLQGVILTYLPFTTPIAIWLLVNFFRDVPIELEEAALLDGCSRFQTFLRIVLPLTLSGLAAVTIYSFLFSWGELMFAMSFLQATKNQTIPMLLSLFVGQYESRWGQMFAGSIIATIPALLIFAYLQRHFVKGLTAGAVKG